MPNEYYDAGAQRAAKVHALFGRIAPRYDLLNDLQSFGLHRYWKRRLIELAHPGLRVQALDVCCGTGDIALALARRGAEVTGLDFNEDMLKVARAKQAGLPFQPASGNRKGPNFIQGDAQALPFEDNRFHIVTVGYGLRNLADWKTGLSEMCRVAACGGRILVLDFGKPDNALWR